jgi:hypothetical protein
MNLWSDRFDLYVMGILEYESKVRREPYSGRNGGRVGSYLEHYPPNLEEEVGNVEAHQLLVCATQNSSPS